MINRKWLLILALSGLVYPGVTLAQTGGMMAHTAIPRPVRVGVILVLPRNEIEFKAIHRENPTYAKYIEMNKTQYRFEQMNQPNLRFYPTPTSSLGFKEDIKHAEEQTILVVGHNLNGNLQFADGTSLHLAEIGSLLNERNKEAIMLSCDANQYAPQFAGPSGPITNKDAIRMVQSISNNAGRLPSSFPDSFRLDTNSVQADIHRIEDLSLITSVAKPAAIGTLTTGGVTALLIRRRSNTKR